MHSSRINKFSHRVIEFGLIFLVIFTPLAFGSVHIWAYSIMELGVILLMGVWAVKSAAGRRSSARVTKMPMLNMLVAAFVGLLLFQLVPLPRTLLKRLSPSTYDLYQMVSSGYDKLGASADSRRLEDDKPPASGWRAISVYPYATRSELFKILSYIGLFYLVANNLTSRKQINRLIVIIILVGCFEAIYGLLEYLSGHQYIFLYKKKYCVSYATGTFINYNHFAGYLEMVIPLGVGMMIYQWLSLPTSPLSGVRSFITRLASEQGSKLALLTLAVIIMLLGVIFSESRMGILSVVTSLLVMTSLLMWGGGSKRFFKLISIVLITGALGGMWLGISPLIERFSYLSGEMGAEGKRLAVWGDTMRMVRDFPLWGSGLGTYRYVFPKYKRTSTQASYYHAHNDYLELAAETGMIGLLIIIGLAACFLRQLIIKWQRRKDPYVKGIVLGGIGGLVALLFHSMTDFNMRIPANPLLLSVIMGVSWRVVTQAVNG